MSKDDLVRCVIGVEELRKAALETFKWLKDVPYPLCLSKSCLKRGRKLRIELFWTTRIRVLMPCGIGMTSGVHGCARHAQSKLKQPTKATVKNFGNRFPEYSDYRTGANSEILNKHLTDFMLFATFKIQGSHRYCSCSLRHWISSRHCTTFLMTLLGKHQRTQSSTGTEETHLGLIISEGEIRMDLVKVAGVA
jgi:hypothetical protein